MLVAVGSGVGYDDPSEKYDSVTSAVDAEAPTEPAIEKSAPAATPLVLPTVPEVAQSLVVVPPSWQRTSP